MLVVVAVGVLILSVVVGSYLMSADFRLRRWSRARGIQHYVGFAAAEAAGVRVQVVDHLLEGRSRRLVKLMIAAGVTSVCVVLGIAAFFSAPPWVYVVIVSVFLTAQLEPLRAVASAQSGLGSENPAQRASARTGLTYVGVAILSVVAGTAALVWAVVSELHGRGVLAWLLLMMFGLATFAVAEMATTLGRRRVAASQEARFGMRTGDRDTLFLRSFDDDSMRLRSINPHVGIFSLFSGLSVRFEELCASMMSKSPLIAIGRPGESVPELGAVRTYVSDDQWQEAVEETAKRVGSIVMVAGVSNGLAWELERIREWDLARRTTVFLPPVDESQAWVRLERVLRQLGIDFDGATSGEDRGPWLGVLLRTVTAIGVDEVGRPLFYVSRRRDWVSFAATLTVSQGIVRGQTQPTPFGHLAELVGIEFEQTTPRDPSTVAELTVNERDGFDAAARRALAEARTQRMALTTKESSDDSLTAEHLFLGITYERSSKARNLLTDMGVNVDELRGVISDSLKG